MGLLIEKGFSIDNCCVYDIFPRRSTCEKKPKIPKPKKESPRETWPEFVESHDQLHCDLRGLGGKITLLLGDEALKTYDKVRQRDGLEKVHVITVDDVHVWMEKVLLPKPRTKN